MDIKLVKGVSLDDLHDTLKEKAIQFYNKALEKGIPIIFTCTGRSLPTQFALYSQGRMPLAEVNILRKKLGLYLLGVSENLYRVTWTLDSKHIITLDRPKALAFDIAVLKDGIASWNLKVNVNNNEVPDYLELAEIGVDLGLTAGAYWNTPDYPHYEININTALTLIK